MRLLQSNTPSVNENDKKGTADVPDELGNEFWLTDISVFESDVRRFGGTYVVREVCVHDDDKVSRAEV